MRGNSSADSTIWLYDFDRTLFDTTRFFEWIWTFLEETYGIDSAMEKERARDYYTYAGDLYDYQFFRHIASIRTITDSAEVVHRRALENQPASFLFPDINSVLDMVEEGRILTYGNAPYQQFKLSFCPELKSVPTDIILIDKGAYISEHYDAAQSIVLVDDKQLAATLPGNVTFIRLDREQGPPYKEHADYISIAALDVLPDIKRRFVDE